LLACSAHQFPSPISHDCTSAPLVSVTPAPPVSVPLQLWDLRSSTTSPLCELVGHTKGILSVDWCPWDQRLVMSAGKDGHTLVWDITQGRAIAEVRTYLPRQRARLPGVPLCRRSVPVSAACLLFHVPAFLTFQRCYPCYIYANLVSAMLAQLQRCCCCCCCCGCDAMTLLFALGC